MAIALVGSANNKGTGVTSLAITVPTTGGAVGDVLVFFLVCVTNQAWSVPAGLSVGYSSRNGAATSTSMYYRVVQAGDPTSYTFTHTTACASAGVCGRYSGVDQTNPIRYWANSLSNNVTAGTSATFPTLFNVGSSDMCVALVGGSSSANNVSTTYTAPAGWTQRQSITANTLSVPSTAAMLCDKTAGTDTPSVTGFSGFHVVNTVCLADTTATPTLNIIRTSPVFQSASTAAVTVATTSLTINAPTGVTNGDLLIACAASSTANSFTLTGSWTQLEIESPPLNGSVTDSAATIWYRIASSEPSSYTIGIGGASKFCGVILRYSMVDNVTIVREISSAYAAVASTTSPARPAFPYTQTTDLVVVFYATGVDASGSSVTVTPPGGTWNTRASVNTAVASTFNCAIAAVDKFGATDFPTSTASATGGWVVLAVALAGLPLIWPHRMGPNYRR